MRIRPLVNADLAACNADPATCNADLAACNADLAALMRIRPLIMQIRPLVMWIRPLVTEVKKTFPVNCVSFLWISKNSLSISFNRIYAGIPILEFLTCHCSSTVISKS